MHFCRLSAVLLVTARAGWADDAAAAAAPETVTLDQVVAAAQASAPGLKLASVTLDSSRAQLVQAQATNGLSLGAKGDYFHQGSVPGTSSSTTASGAAAASASGSGVNGENIQGGLTLSGPATSLGLTAQHSIVESARVTR